MATARQIIANILRVDHAGEYGAIRIYQAQRLLAGRRAPDLLAFLDHALEDERRHRDTFERLMRERDIVPCRTLAFWGAGGFLLGLCTGLMGRSAILVCTEAVERTVHLHLTDHVRWLEGPDPVAAVAIAAIQVEEIEHLQFAEDRRRRSPRVWWTGALDGLVAAATEALIWLSTYGAPSRMPGRPADSSR